MAFGTILSSVDVDASQGSSGNQVNAWFDFPDDTGQEEGHVGGGHPDAAGHILYQDHKNNRFLLSRLISQQSCGFVAHGVAGVGTRMQWRTARAWPVGIGPDVAHVPSATVVGGVLGLSSGFGLCTLGARSVSLTSIDAGADSVTFTFYHHNTVTRTLTVSLPDDINTSLFGCGFRGVRVAYLWVGVTGVGQVLYAIDLVRGAVVRVSGDTSPTPEAGSKDAVMLGYCGRLHLMSGGDDKLSTVSLYD